MAVKFWVPNLGAHVPVSLTTGLPDYSEYVKSGLWLPRRRLRICGGSDEVAYFPDGDRSWPATFPVLNMKVYDTFCEMQGVRPEQAINPVSALEVLEGQVALVHHIMAFEEANPAVHILSPRQKWKAGFLAYFLGAVSKGQLEVMKKLGDESYAASLADRGCWQVRTSKGLVYELRHSRDIALGRFNDALFENIDKKLQAFRWAPHKILGFLLGNTKTRFSVHVQLRRLHYDDVPSIDWYISLSAVQGHTRVSPTAESIPLLASLLTKERRRSLGLHLPCHPQQELGEHQNRGTGAGKKPGILVKAAASLSTWFTPVGSEAPRAGDAHRLWQVLVLLQCEV